MSTSQSENHKLELETAFKKYYSPLCNYAYSFIPITDACEDIVQEVFFKIWDKKLLIKSSISSYLYTSVRNACLDQIRSNFRKSIIPIDEIEDPIDNPFDLEKEENLQNIKTKVANAIDNLPPRCRDIFILRRNQQMSYDEISETLNISKKTIENQMNTAIRKLRASLSKSEIMIYFFLTAKEKK
ncbi:MAG: RNA polymerase sigma-70 factor [Marinifilaceae bacterium]